MSKFARFLWRHNETDQSVHLVDVIDMAVYPPPQSLGCKTEGELLSKLFQPNEAQWRADDEWFVAVPQGVQNGATFSGIAGEESDPMKYINPDNTYGDGTPIPPPTDE